jgi:predicted dehydrogenase
VEQIGVGLIGTGHMAKCHDLLRRLAGQPARIIDFDAGLGIERAIRAMYESAVSGSWVAVPE